MLNFCIARYVQCLHKVSIYNSSLGNINIKLNLEDLFNVCFFLLASCQTKTGELFTEAAPDENRYHGNHYQATGEIGNMSTDIFREADLRFNCSFGNTKTRF